MRILVVHRYYWPDFAPCAEIIHAVARHLTSIGFEVDVLSSQPSYRGGENLPRRPKFEVNEGIRVSRLNLPVEKHSAARRVANALILGYMTIAKAIVNRYDLIVATTIPPVLGGLFSVIAARMVGARLVYYCMDLHPEIGRASGDFSNRIIFKILQRIDDWTCRRADLVLVHSEDMRRTLEARRGGSKYNIEILNNFSIPSEPSIRTSQPEPLPDLIVKGRLALVYAGNMGRFQGLETLIDAMGRIAHRDDISLVMVGDGVNRPALVERALSLKANVQFVGQQSIRVAKQIIGRSDLGIVSLAPGIYRYAYPSKTMTYLEQGKPILVVVEEESELAHSVKAGNYGFTAPIGKPAALADLFEVLADDGSWREPMSDAAVQAFQSDFSASVVLRRWEKVVRRFLLRRLEQKRK